MMTHKVDHLGVDGRARKTQARHHHRVSWTCFCSEREMARGEEVLFCEARVSLGMVVVGDRRLIDDVNSCKTRRKGGRSELAQVGATFSRYVCTSKEDYYKVCTYLHLSLVFSPLSSILTF
jgi:hypothetical protein